MSIKHVADRSALMLVIWCNYVQTKQKGRKGNETFVKKQVKIGCRWSCRLPFGKVNKVSCACRGSLCSWHGNLFGDAKLFAVWCVQLIFGVLTNFISNRTLIKLFAFLELCPDFVSSLKKKARGWRQIQRAWSCLAEKQTSSWRKKAQENNCLLRKFELVCERKCLQGSHMSWNFGILAEPR